LDGRSDKNLVIASGKGDRRAYALLIERYYRQVFLVCIGTLGNVHDAEDMAQEAMLQGFVQIRQLRDGSQFGSWVLRIARNMCVNLARRRERAARAVVEKAMQRKQTPARNDNLQQAIERLPEAIRLPLIMYYFNGQSVKMVADKLNISRPGVYLKLRAATKRLHELLVEQEDEG
jgi:RNA polymerase sigma-70 factor (ECF subfamily)